MPGRSELKVPKVLRCLTTASVFVLLSCLFGAFFVFRTPLLWGFDETSHAARAYQVSQGNVFADYLGDNRADMGYGGKIPANMLSLIIYVDNDLLSSVGTPHVHDAGGYNRLGRLYLSPPGAEYAFPNTAAYSPVAYLPSAAAFRLAGVLGLDIAWTIYLARFSDLAFYVACVTCALHVLRRTRFRWALFVVALLPVSIFEASTITADTATTALCFLLSALVIKAFFLDQGLSKADEALLFCAAAAIPVLKPSYFLVDALVLFIPASGFTSRFSALAVKAGALSLGLAGFAAWQVATSPVASAVSLMRPGPGWQLVSPHKQLHYLLAHPFSAATTLVRTIRLHGTRYIQQVFGQLSFANVNIPIVSLLLSAAAMLTAALFVEPVKIVRRGQVAAIGAVVVATFLLIFLVEYLSWSDVGNGFVQGVNGRYFVPLLVLVVGALAVVSPVRAAIKRRSHENRVAALIGAMVVVSLILSCARFDHVVWR